MVNIGRFGPFVKYGAKYASLKKDDDPYTIGLERALEIVREKEALDAARTIREFPEQGVRILKGRFGPYVTDAGRRASIPKDRDPATVTLEEALKLLDEAPAKKGARKKKSAAKKAPAKKAATKKKAGKKTAARKKPAGKKAAAKKTASKKSAAKKSAAKKTAASKSTAKKAAAKKSGASGTTAGKRATSGGDAAGAGEAGD